MSRYGLLAVGVCFFLTSPCNQVLASPLVPTGPPPVPQAATGDQKALLQQKLNSQFQLVKTTADGSDIVKAGSVLVLQKDGLLMCNLDTRIPPTSSYKGGKISFGFGAALAWEMELGTTNSNDVPQRKFVAGEKFWVKNIDVQDDGVIFDFYSDPYQDVRYHGKLKFPFPKHTMPSADDEMKTIAEAITVQPDDNAAASAPAPAPAQSSKMADIPPPPPPPDAPPPQPKTITLGMTKEQVVAIFGQPKSIANLGTKEIDNYPDMKVTFVKGKVADVQ
jgi:hypothetical protein